MAIDKCYKPILEINNLVYVVITEKMPIQPQLRVLQLVDFTVDKKTETIFMII